MDAFSEPKWEPVSIEAEQGILGCILVNNEAYRFVSDILKPTDFYESAHMHIYQVIENLMVAGRLADWKTLITLLPDVDIAGMKMRQYLARLAAEATTIINARDYAMIIRDLAKRRDLMDVGARLGEMKPGGALEIAGAAIEEIDAMVADLSNAHTRGLTAGAMMAATIDQAAKAFAADGRILGLPTGLSKLDRKTLGLTPGQLIIIGGRPGSGKSCLMTSMARAMAGRGHRGVLFSLEMDEVELGQRMIADDLFNSGPMTYFNLRAGRFEEQAFNRVREAAERLSKLPLTIEPKPAQTLGEIATRVRQAKRKGGLDFFFVDHLHIMALSGDKMSRNDGLGEITVGLKNLAKETDTVALVLAQLSRAVESRDNKRPQMSDLRDSGNIEQDANQVWMLYRDSYYLERREPPKGTEEHAVWQTAVFRAQNRLEISIEKQRAGPTGVVDVFCNIACNAVRDLDEHEVEATASIPSRNPDDDPRFI